MRGAIVRPRGARSATPRSCRHLRTFHARSDGTYGVPRLIDDLREVDIHVGQKRMARVMRLGGLVGVSHRRGMRTTRRGTVADAYDNAMAESSFATLECERIDRRTYRTHSEARMDHF